MFKTNSQYQTLATRVKLLNTNVPLSKGHQGYQNKTGYNYKRQKLTFCMYKKAELKRMKSLVVIRKMVEPNIPLRII